MCTRIMIAVLALLTLFAASGCREADLGSISVPQGKPVAIDGTMDPGEWDHAAVEQFADGSELLLMYSEGYLYLGVRANTPGMIAGNVFVVHGAGDGNEIAILHTSAALGTARYEKAGDVWQQTSAFEWRCRRIDQSAAAQAEREAFLQDEGWVSINSRVGTPNELEYQIELPSGIHRLAVNYIRASDPNVKTPWPGDLDDDCVKPTPGGPPAEMHFSPDQWAAIRIP